MNIEFLESKTQLPQLRLDEIDPVAFGLPADHPKPTLTYNQNWTMSLTRTVDKKDGMSTFKNLNKWLEELDKYYSGDFNIVMDRLDNGIKNNPKDVAAILGHIKLILEGAKPVGLKRLCLLLWHSQIALENYLQKNTPESIV